MNELGASEFLELGLVTSLTPLDLNNIHSTNIYLGHQRSRGRLHPLHQLPGDEVGPSEGAVGCREREVVRLSPAAELSPVSQRSTGTRGWPCGTSTG